MRELLGYAIVVFTTAIGTTLIMKGLTKWQKR